ncbi:MAG TPA: helix-turn-helix domain-containing protein [Candidatus Thermoplasmatota archaeon]
MLGPHLSRNICLIAFVALVVPLSAAQSGPAGFSWVELIRDGRSDVRSNAPVSLLTPQTAYLDLDRVSIQETADSYRVEFRTYEEQNAGSSTVKTTFGFTLFDNGAGKEYEVEIRGDGSKTTTPDWFEIWVDGARVSGPASISGSPWHYDAEISRMLFTGDRTWGVGDRVTRTWALVEDPQAGQFAASDRGPDSGFGANFTSTYNPTDERNLNTPKDVAGPGWSTTEGPDFAAGPAIAIGPDGTAHVSYIVYNSERGTTKGLYHATLQNDGMTAIRVADASMRTELHEDGNTQTAIDVDNSGRVHIVYHPHPNGTEPDEVRYALLESGAWKVEDPAQPAGTRLTVDDGYRSNPAVAALNERVVVAFHEATEKFAVVERTGADEWKLVREIDGRLPKMALDAQGKIHIAYFQTVADGYPNRGVDGNLLYTTETHDWKAQTIATDIEELTRFWTGSEADGSFAFALAPDGTPHFVWEGSRDARHYGILEDTGLKVSDTPLTPVHGNPQLRIRMAIDLEGYSHIMSGYGGSDIYAVRSPKGQWYKTETDRGDMFSLDVRPEGRAIATYTEPHGGTTIAVASALRRPGQSIDADSASETPVFPGTPVIPGPGIAAVAGGALLAIGILVPRGVDRAPRLFGAPLAILSGFSRLKKNELLDHETREEIVEAITSSPGRTAASVRKALGLSRTTFFYHLRRLEQEGLVRVARRGAQLYLETPAIFAGRTEPATVEARIFRAAVEAPGMAAADYARMLQLHERTVRHHLLSLERRGELRSERASARNVHWFGGAGRGQN